MVNGLSDQRAKWIPSFASVMLRVISFLLTSCYGVSSQLKPMPKIYSNSWRLCHGPGPTWIFRLVSTGLPGPRATVFRGLQGAQQLDSSYSTRMNVSHYILQFSLTIDREGATSEIGIMVSLYSLFDTWRHMWDLRSTSHLVWASHC